jgi:hypothetical protein
MVSAPCCAYVAYPTRGLQRRSSWANPLVYASAPAAEAAAASSHLPSREGQNTEDNYRALARRSFLPALTRYREPAWASRSGPFPCVVFFGVEMRPVYRIRTEYRRGGVGRVLTFTAHWVRRRLFPFLPPGWWAAFSPSNVPSATLPRTHCSTVLVLAFPRSGSSWVGEILGSATNALYLREPITQTYLRHCQKTRQQRQAVFHVDDLHIPEVYWQAAVLAFAGVPAFTPDIVTVPEQWRLLSLQRRRLVIKEVNPMAAEWLLRRYRPRVVYLLRHPAAVAASFVKLGWVERPIDREFGEWLAAAYRSALDFLSIYRKQVIVPYEELCANPVTLFRELFTFAGLSWDAQVESRIREHSFGLEPGDQSDPFGTTRDSRRMIRSWVGQLDQDEIADLRAGYLSSGLTWYSSPDDWS